MRISRLIVALVAFLVGLLWIGQGSGVLAGGAMSNSTFWAVAGVALVAIAVAVAWLEYRSPADG